MGKRQLLVSPNMLVEFLKAWNGMPRTYSVEHALPDDARVVDILTKRNGNLALILESAEWVGQSEIELESPIVIVHYGEV